MAEQYVYFIQDVKSFHIKIGIAADPHGRLAQLKTGNPRELRLLGYMVGGRKLEQAIHKQLAYWHVDGEWFRKDGVFEYIATIPVEDWVWLRPPTERVIGASGKLKRRRWTRVDRQSRRNEVRAEAKSAALPPVKTFDADEWSGAPLPTGSV